ncbi:Peptidase E [Microbacterium sp. ru370.1]|uniref:Type 1 glutamine amidotransferase-like domain-containing protein n=1 Tax=unclassified Microbacterium TaxID=2609290 RepID=UPI000886AC37|nr:MULTISPECIES: peptidase E [unclassified Microbacterium]SDO41322.1 Peptidase E [Microbacterium sp. ru370.1]SIT79814.1 Peptidase E [Microbacterium sp. RU1D]
MSVPRILATCGGWADAPGADVAFGPLLRFALELTGAEGRPRIVFVGTAGGDQRIDEGRELAAAMAAGVDAVHLRLFGRTAVDLDEVLGDADLVWVGGGSVVNLLPVWRAHGLDAALRRAGEGGTLLAGTSAGALCWHEGGPTSGFGEIRTITDGLGFIPGSLGVHYDSQPGRRPALHRAIATGTLPGGFGLDEGAAVLYEGTRAVDVVSELPTGRVHRVDRHGDGVVEEALPTRLL